MANIKKGFKRIERVLLVLGCLISLILCITAELNNREVDEKALYRGEVIWKPADEFKVGRVLYQLVWFTPIFLAPYFLFKLIVWLVMGFKDDDDIKVEEEVKDDEVKDEKE